MNKTLIGLLVVPSFILYSKNFVYNFSYRDVAKARRFLGFKKKSIQLMNQDGLFSFILPNKFLKATYGKEIRKVI